MRIRCLQPAYMSPCSCGVSWFTLSESWFSLRCLDRNVWICTTASSEVSAFVLELVLWLRCDGKEKAESLAGAVSCWSLMAQSVSHIIHISCDGKHTRHVCRETILDRTNWIFSWQQVITYGWVVNAEYCILSKNVCLYKIINGDTNDLGWHLTDAGL